MTKDEATELTGAVILARARLVALFDEADVSMCWEPLGYPDRDSWIAAMDSVAVDVAGQAPPRAVKLGELGSHPTGLAVPRPVR